MSTGDGYIWKSLLRRLGPGRAAPAYFWLFLVGTFFVFAPVGFVFEISRERTPTWSEGVGNAVVTGTIGAAWAALGIRRLIWPMPVLLLGQFLGAAWVMNQAERLGLFRFGAEATRQERLSAMGLMAIVSLAVGFAGMMRAGIMSERRSAGAKAELDVAQRIHRNLVPPIDSQEHGVHIVGCSEASSTMGGDLIDMIRRDGEIDVFLADVSGHGVGAGIVMGMVKSAIRMRLRRAAALADLVADLNATLTDLTEPHMFATLACVRIRDGGRVEYALAGHLPILHVRAATGDIVDLPNQSLPLGIEADESFASGSTILAPGDLLVLLTDGLIEVQNRRGRELGLNAIRRVSLLCAARPLHESSAAILACAAEHGPRLDDQSLVLIRRSRTPVIS